MRGVVLALLAVIAVVATTAFAGDFGATETAKTSITETASEHRSGNVIPFPPVPSPTPSLTLHTRWYLSGDIAQGCRVMYSEPKNGSYIFVPYRGEVIWIAYNSSGQYTAGEWTGHIKKMGYECVVSIGVFDNRTKEFYVCGSATITEPEQNFTIHTWAFSVDEDQYLAFRVYSPSYWVKVVTCDGACYIDKWLCDIRIEDDGYAGVLEAEVKKFDGEVVFVRGFAGGESA